MQGGKKIVWIAWERQRRSLSISRLLQAELCLVLYKGRYLRHIFSILATLPILFRYRRELVFVQNPSMILAALACALKPLLKYTLVVDRHSNFLFSIDSTGTTLVDDEVSDEKSIMRKLLIQLSIYSIRRADLTIVTNSTLANYIEKKGGTPFLLPDPFPEVPSLEAADDDGRGKMIFFISSWAWDEPIEEVIEATRSLPVTTKIVISGRPRSSLSSVVEASPPNFICAGFLSDEDFFRYIVESNAVMVLTTRPATLVCGGYEALALGKPLILSNTKELREYFEGPTVFVENNRTDIKRGIVEMLDSSRNLSKDAKLLFDERSAQWSSKFKELKLSLGL